MEAISVWENGTPSGTFEIQFDTYGEARKVVEMLKSLLIKEKKNESTIITDD